MTEFEKLPFNPYYTFLLSTCIRNRIVKSYKIRRNFMFLYRCTINSVVVNNVLTFLALFVNLHITIVTNLGMNLIMYRNFYSTRCTRLYLRRGFNEFIFYSSISSDVPYEGGHPLFGLISLCISIYLLYLKIYTYFVKTLLSMKGNL